jgi:hypothetical protein
VVAAGDIDSDGDLDLVVNTWFNEVAETVWYENRDGLGQFGPKQTISAGYVGSLVVGDIDGDGDVDIVNNATDGTRGGIINILLNQGGGAFAAMAPISVPSNVGFGWLKLADVDRDSDLDLVAQYRWFENASDTGSFVDRGSLLSDARILEIGDYNSDGWMDAVVSRDLSGAEFMLGTSSWSEFERGPFTTALGHRSEVVRVVVDDFDRDGAFDVAIVEKENTIDRRHAVKWFQQTDGEFGAGTTLLPMAYRSDRGLLATDIDGDGHSDLIYDGDYQLFAPTIAAFSTAVPLNPVSGDWPQDVADVDGDGDLDVTSLVYRRDCFYEAIMPCELSAGAARGRAPARALWAPRARPSGPESAIGRSVRGRPKRPAFACKQSGPPARRSGQGSGGP